MPPVACARDRRHQLLQHLHHVAVVRVGLVGLDHRELGVVLVAHALVAEVLAQLVDLLEAAHDAALEVELGGDPQVEVAVERVVVGHERPRGRAAVDRLQGRGLDLHEAAVVEEAAHAPRSALERVTKAAADVGVGHQVEVAAAEAQSRGRAGRRACPAGAAGPSRAARPRPRPRSARRGGCAPPARRPRRCPRGRGRGAPPSPPRPGGRRSPRAGCGRCGRRGRGRRPCPARGAPPGGRRRAPARRRSPRPRAPRWRRAPRRSPAAPRSGAGTGRRPALAQRLAPWRGAPRSAPRDRPRARRRQSWSVLRRPGC